MEHMSNPLATPEQLYRRSSFSSLPPELLDTVYFATQCLTQAAGLLLQLPQSVTAQANVILARYWLIEPPMAHEFSHVSAACIYLVAKMGPSPRSPRDVANTYAYLLSPASAFFANKKKEEEVDATVPPPLRPTTLANTSASAATSTSDASSCYLPESRYTAFRTAVLALEARVLYALSFDTHVALPHPLAVTYLQALDFLSYHPREALAARALAHLNTALLSPQLLCVTHQPNALAVAAVYCAARDVGARAPQCAWWEVFDVDREELGFLVVGMRSVEGWARQQRGETPLLFEGVLTRAKVEAELERRGWLSGNGKTRGGEVEEEEDEEARMAREMDRKAALMEAGQ